MGQQPPIHIKSISEFHERCGLPQPEHELISVVRFADIKQPKILDEQNWVFDFYQITMKCGLEGQMKYGQSFYNYNKNQGVMLFIAPLQVFKIQRDEASSAVRTGWLLLIHPDFLWNTTLAKNIKHYDFFDYSANEALLLSQREQATLNGVIETIQQEYNQTLDRFSKQIIISQIETLLHYSERFYQRQFLVREKSNHQIITRLEALLNDYFKEGDLISKGLPTVQYAADNLQLSSKYLSTLLKTITGLSTQQHIHQKLIELAKEKLSNTDLSVGEIAYQLGFEYPQSFSKLFKQKTEMSPLQFRAEFN